MNEHDKSMRTQDALSHLTGRELRLGFNDTDTSPGEMAAWHRYVAERDSELMKRRSNVSDFKHGDKVRYVPSHAHGDAKHKDCQNGVVSSTNEKWVFVKYDNSMCIMTTGDESYTAAATNPEDLIK